MLVNAEKINDYKLKNLRRNIVYDRFHLVILTPHSV